jgi:hypothetical protein
MTKLSINAKCYWHAPNADAKQSNAILPDTIRRCNLIRMGVVFLVFLLQFLYGKTSFRPDKINAFKLIFREFEGRSVEIYKRS